MKVIFYHFGCLFCSFVFGNAMFAPAIFSQTQGKYLVQSESPLTVEMVDRAADFFEWSLGIKLSIGQKGEFRESLVEAWRKNDKATIDGAGQLLSLHSELSKLSDAQLSQVRGKIRDEVLASLRQEPIDKTSGMLLTLYETSQRSNSNRTENKRASAPVKVGAGDLYGVYIATTKQLIAPVEGNPPGSQMSGSELIKRGITWQPGREWITFLPGGRVFFYLPEEGLAGNVNTEFEKERQSNPAFVGTYQIKGGTVHIRRASGEEETITRGADGELWKETKNYTPLPKSDGLRLDGKYAVLWNEGSAQHFIRFSPEGKFEENGVLKFIGYKSLASPPESALAEVPRGNGLYSIGNNTLHLRYSDGREAKISVYAFEEELKKPRPAVIYINGFDFGLTR